MYVRSLQMTNFRCFRRVEELPLQYRQRPGSGGNGALGNVNLLLGTNGSGKTTILKALALAVLSPVIQESGYKPYYLVRRCDGKPVSGKTAVECRLLLHGQDVGGDFRAEVAESSPSAKIKIRGSYERIDPDRSAPHIDRMYDDDSPAFFVVGYGATRRVEHVEHLDLQSSKRRSVRYQRVAGLFEEYITLFPLGAWLPNVQTASKARFQEVRKLIDRLLPPDTQFEGTFEDHEPLFRHRGVTLPFGALSDGYRAYIGLVGDLLYHLHRCCPKPRKLTDVSGLVMVDDIDLHLHPSWQRTVVPDLARTFSRLQFVLTTHSPIVAGTLHAENVRVVDGTDVKRFDEPVHGRSADQILTSSYFNLPTSRSIDTEKKLTGLADEVARRGDPKAAVEFLKQLAGKNDDART